MYVDMSLKANLVKRSSMVLITCFPAFSAMLITKGPTLAITSSRMPSCLLPLDGEINCSTEINLGTHKGDIYENIVGDMLVK